MPAKRLAIKPYGRNSPLVWMLNRPLTGPKINKLGRPAWGHESPNRNLKSASCAQRPGRLARCKDGRDDGKGSDDRERLCRPGGRVETAPVGGASAHHRTHRRGALARGPLRERGVSRRQGRAVA